MELIKFRRGQFVLVEILLIGLLFSSLLYLTYNSNRDDVQSYYYTVDSSIDAIYYSESFRNIILNEDLSVIDLTQNWTELESILNNKFKSYEFVISNITDKKTIFDGCAGDYHNKIIKERIIALKNISNYEFRIIKLGVCS
ncbi:MAG: hypothetical protein ACOCP8_08575 [archaeon]